MVETTRRLLKDSAAARWTALVLLALMMFFAYLFVDILSPLKSILEVQLGWNGTTFGLYAGAEFFLNVFVLFLIIAGIILDKMGVRFTVLLSGGLMVLGGAIKYYAVSGAFIGSGFEAWMNSWWTSFPATAKLASLGFMIFGSGCEMAGITVSKAIVKWFKGKEMALAMGTEMAIARIGVAAAMLLSPRIAAANPQTPISSTVFFGFSLLVVGFMCFIVYVFLDAKLDRQMGESGVEPEDPFHFRDLGKVLTNKPFIIISLLCVTYYSAIFPFQRYAVNMLESNLGMTPAQAGNIFFWFPIGAAAITPLLGNFLDTRGKGASMLMVGAIMMFVCHMIFAVVPLNTFIALTAIIILGISFSLVPASLWPSVPKLVPETYLGTAYALIFWIQNIGLMVFPIAIGRILDSTNQPGTPANELNYTPAMLTFACLGVIAFVLGMWLKREDKQHNYGLELPNKH